MKKTIELILGYPPFTPEQISLLRVIGLYNGTGSDGIFFDKIIDALFETLEEAKVFDHSKAMLLREDIEQLVIRHDIDFHSKIGRLRANKRLAGGIYRLLHKFPRKYRLLASFPVFYAVHCTKKSKEVYYT